MATSSAIDADPEQARLAALRSYRLMDTAPEVRLALQIEPYGITRDLIPCQVTALKMLTAETMDLFEQRRIHDRATGDSTPPIGAKVEFTCKRNLLIVDDDDAVRSFVCVASRK